MPDALTIEFTNELHHESTVAVASTITVSPDGEKVYGDGKLFKAAAQSNNRSRSITVPLDPNLPNGLYWVKWSTVAARAKARSFGDSCFTVGMPIPEDIIRDRPTAVVEHNSGYRDQRAVLAGGILLLALGITLPFLSGQPSTPLRKIPSRHSSLKRD